MAAKARNKLFGPNQHIKQILVTQRCSEGTGRHFFAEKNHLGLEAWGSYHAKQKGPPWPVSFKHTHTQSFGLVLGIWVMHDFAPRFTAVP